MLTMTIWFQGTEEVLYITTFRKAGMPTQRWLIASSMEALKVRIAPSRLAGLFASTNQIVRAAKPW